MASISKHKLSSSSCGPRPSRTWSIHKICENFAMYGSLRCTVVILTSGMGRTTIVQKGPTCHGRRTMIRISQLTVHHGTHTFLARARKDHKRTCLHHDLIFLKKHTVYVANMQPCTTTQIKIHYVVIYIHNCTLKDHNLGQVLRCILSIE